jgi:hypothetical protein
VIHAVCLSVLSPQIGELDVQQRNLTRFQVLT